VIYDTTALSGWADGFESMKEIVRTSSRIVVPLVVLGEYEFGLRGSGVRKRRKLWLEEALHLCEVVPITHRTVKIYADLAHALKTKGCMLGQNDIWIAATAFELNLKAIVSNDKDFDHVEGISRLGFYDPRHAKA